jgi:uncharacterized OsmC-like protein
MASQDVAVALQRAEEVLRRRPSAGLHDDATAVATWDGGMRIVASHALGRRIATDMPPELGGSGGEVTPGWLVRAGLASCTATSIAMAAAGEGIELDALEVRATSRSDARGLFGITEGDGAAVYPGLRDVKLHVRVAAPGVAPERLRALVTESQRSSPMLTSIQGATPVGLSIEIGAA